MSQEGPSRPLLIRGEALRLEVSQPGGGGGEKYEPQGPEEARQLLLPMVQQTVRAAAQLPAGLRGHRLYVEARLLPNYLAASHFPSVLLHQVGAMPVGSREEASTLRTARREVPAATRRLILALSDDGLQRLQTIIENPTARRSRTDIQAFQEIRKFDDFGMRDPADVLINLPPSDDEILMCEAVLHPGGTLNGLPFPIEDDTLEKWFTLVDDAGGEVRSEYVRRVGGLTFVPVRLTVGAAKQVARFNPLRAMRPMPVIRPFPHFGLRAVRRFLPPSSTTPTASAPRVAVFDGGIDPGAGSPFFSAGSVALTNQPPDVVGTAHGTGVGGAVMYGLAVPGRQANPPPVPVDHFRVYPPDVPDPDLGAYWMLDQIKAKVFDADYDIVNLSLGYEECVEESGEPNRWTSELDQLAWERNVLFVVAAGNNGSEDRVTGLHRVQTPADMVNGLSVGACDTPVPDQPWARASYSAMGPGRHGNRVQPTGVQFGGCTARPFPLLRADGTLIDQEGTSFAAPLVTHALADLGTRLPQRTPSVLRAFAVHFAERRKRGHSAIIDELGYGRFPISFREYLECRPNEAHVLFVDSIKRLERLGYLLPVPSSSTGSVEIELTLCYASPVDPSEPTEYTRASLELALRPHRNIIRFTAPQVQGGKTPSAKELDITSEEARTLLEAGWRFSGFPVTKTLAQVRGRSETALREAGKWETVRRFRQKFKPGDLLQPRLELAYLARRTGALDDSPSEVPFALLITAREPASSKDLYERTRAEFPQLVTLPVPGAQIRVRAR